MCSNCLLAPAPLNLPPHLNLPQQRVAPILNSVTDLRFNNNALEINHLYQANYFASFPVTQARGSNIQQTNDATFIQWCANGSAEGIEATYINPDPSVAQKPSIPRPRKTFTCPTCQKIFTSRYRLQTHTNRFHTASPNQKLYHCETCSYKTCYKTDVNRHRKRCTDAT
ncbi:hypothetical protein HYPSUDRAFT_73055 [Hypholoma sublateritium FD-334 SS-4]|uniref:C2H2-type domain-containing protein n=1 Tax=Hypholoma sublateritium (strain FD-334 SS-4) TaxID=945553 RepID=A0A0D2N297_HYPSF|nr:hypothetical protein HYPSUDRAFT_73055 [Hypholoma sublateritium FD-334 SS-4]